MTQGNDLLNDLLPMLGTSNRERHDNIAVLEVSDQAQLLELAVNPKVRRYLIARLSDTMAVIDPGKVEALVKTLRAEGNMPKMEKGV